MRTEQKGSCYGEVHKGFLRRFPIPLRCKQDCSYLLCEARSPLARPRSTTILISDHQRQPKLRSAHPQYFQSAAAGNFFLPKFLKPIHPCLLTSTNKQSDQEHITIPLIHPGGFSTPFTSLRSFNMRYRFRFLKIFLQHHFRQS